MPSIQKRPVSVAEEIAALVARVRQLETRTPTIIPPTSVPGFSTLLGTSTRAASQTLGAAVFPAFTAGFLPNVSFTLTVAGVVLVIGTTTLTEYAGVSASAWAAVGVVGHGYQYPSYAANGNSAGAADKAVTSFFTVSLAAGNYTAEWAAAAAVSSESEMRFSSILAILLAS